MAVLSVGPYLQTFTNLTS